MKLFNAMLCLDCDELNERDAEVCKCSSKALIPLTQWIQPLETREEMELVRTIEQVSE